MRAARPIAVTIALLAGLSVGSVAARQRLLDEAEARLRGAGLRWTERHTTLTGARWEGLESDGLRIEAVQARLWPRPDLLLEGVRIDLQRGGRPAELDGSAASSGTAALGLAAPPVRVEGASVRWGERVLLEGLSGSLRPELSLTGPAGRVWDEEGGLRAELEWALDQAPLRARLRIQVREAGDEIRATLASDDLEVHHALLAARPLGPWSLRAEAALDRATRAVELRGTLGSLPVQATLRPDPQGGWVVHGSALDLPLSAVIELFADQIPEARAARCEGRIGVIFEAQAAPKGWKIEPRAQGLRCKGLLGDPDALREGSVSWRARAADGSPRLARTGPGEPGFTPWLQGQRVAEAFVASEDIRFFSHPGYDLSAIEEALAEAAAGEERPRGGSTITQQLAKNLFTGDERTLVRKLRELMYTLDLEGSLQKRHILQLYINIVELGPELYGVGPAADLYFAKSAAGLTDKEAAFLATLLPSPVRGHERASRGKLAEARIDAILSTMARAKLRSAEEIERARRQKLVLLVRPP